MDEKTIFLTAAAGSKLIMALGARIRSAWQWLAAADSSDDAASTNAISPIRLIASSWSGASERGPEGTTVTEACSDAETTIGLRGPPCANMT
jgi:hypothetical protein